MLKNEVQASVKLNFWYMGKNFQRAAAMFCGGGATKLEVELFLEDPHATIHLSVPTTTR